MMLPRSCIVLVPALGLLFVVFAEGVGDALVGGFGWPSMHWA
jgi:hypothetical protein